MGILETIGNGAKRTQLRAEVALIEREMTARKKAFGVELYDVIIFQTKRDKNSLLKTPGIVKVIENTIQGPLSECSTDVVVLETERGQLEDEAEIIEAKGDRDVNGGIGKRLSNGAREGQIAVKISLLNRDIRIRKEKFGLEVWDTVSESQWSNPAAALKSEAPKLKGIVGAFGGIARGVQGSVGKTLGKVSGDARTVEECLNKAKADIASMERRKQIKLTEISHLP
jgi:hypothetical protein